MGFYRHCYGGSGSQQTEYIDKACEERFTNLGIGRTSYRIIPCKNVADSILINVKALHDDFNDLPLDEKIKTARILAGLTAAEIAERAGINVSTYSNYETGNFNIEMVDVSVIKRIAVSCGLNEYALCDEFQQFRDNSAANVLRVMDEQGFTIKGMAELYEVSETSVKAWRKGKCVPRREIWERVFKLNCRE